jgi:antitoxin ParD1/3/4
MKTKRLVLDKLPSVGNYCKMGAALTNYWQEFINKMVASGRYNNRSEVIRAGLRALEERELKKEAAEFEEIFTGGRMGKPDDKSIGRMVARQKSRRKAR